VVRFTLASCLRFFAAIKPASTQKKAEATALAAVGSPSNVPSKEKMIRRSPYGAANPKSCVGDWQRTVRRLGIIAGVHIHAHRWRHYFATQLLSKGVPVSEVAAILGNSARTVEKHYS
jgi:integrase